MEALGLSHVARAPVLSISEIRRRQLRVASDPGDLQNEERERATAGVDERGGASAAVAAAVISRYALIYSKLKRMLKNTVAVSGDGQKRMGALLAQCFSGSVAPVGATVRSSNADAFAPAIINSTGWWSATLTCCAAVLSASAAPADQQLGIEFQNMSRTLALNSLRAAGKVQMLHHGSRERLDVAVPTIMNKLLETVPQVGRRSGVPNRVADSPVIRSVINNCA